jgi:hypothetical protein
VPALDAHVYVLDGRVPQWVITRKLVEFGDHGLVALAFSSLMMSHSPMIMAM